MPQFGLIREATRAFNLPCIEMAGLRGRRHHRHLRLAGPRRRRAGDDRLRRQGPDAARLARDRDVRHAEDAPHRARGGVREVRRAAGAGDRRAGAGRRLGRQRAGRAGDRDQDRGGADPGVRRPRHAAGAGGRDQAAEAPRDAAGLRRPDPGVARPRHAEVRRPGRGPARGARGPRAEPADAARLPRPDGVPHPGRARRGQGWRDPGGAGGRRLRRGVEPPRRRRARGRAGRPTVAAGAAIPTMPPIDRTRYEVIHDAAARSLGARASATSGWWRSTPRPPRSTRCGRSSSASRSASGRARRPTCRSATSRAAATCSARRRGWRARSTRTRRWRS